MDEMETIADAPCPLPPLPPLPSDGPAGADGFSAGGAGFFSLSDGRTVACDIRRDATDNPRVGGAHPDYTDGILRIALLCLLVQCFFIHRFHRRGGVSSILKIDEPAGHDSGVPTHSTLATGRGHTRIGCHGEG